MCGRFVQRYTWDDIQELYDLPDGPRRNLPVALQHRPGRGCAAGRWRNYRIRLNALGPHSMVVEKAFEAIAGELQTHERRPLRTSRCSGMRSHAIDA
jgi:hypothetical protein